MEKELLDFGSIADYIKNAVSSLTTLVSKVLASAGTMEQSAKEKLTKTLEVAQSFVKTLSDQLNALHSTMDSVLSQVQDLEKKGEDIGDNLANKLSEELTALQNTINNLLQQLKS